MQLPLARAGLATAALLITFAAAESLVRLAMPPPRYHSALLELDPELGFAGVPGFAQQGSDARGPFHLELNDEGFRGPLFAQRSEEGPRIVFLGDSFLVGESLREDELVTEQLAERLRARGAGASVHNLGTINYGTAQELLQLRRYAAALEPTEVVLAFYPGNDIANNGLALAGATQVSPGDYLRPYLQGPNAPVTWTHPLRAALRGSSRLFAYAERAVLASAIARGFSPLGPRPSINERLQRGQLPREELELYRSHDPGHRWERAWQTSLALIRGIRDECEALKARLLVLVIPTSEQVQRTAPIRALDAAWRSYTGRSIDSPLDWNLPERRLAHFFEAEKIDARLLLPELRALARDRDDVYTRDQHLGSAGHALLSERVLEWLDGVPSPSCCETVRGLPVARLPAPAEAPTTHDFGLSPGFDFLGDGWIEWRRHSPGTEAAGWLLGTRGLVIVPAREGELRLRVSPQGALFRGRVELGNQHTPLALAPDRTYELRIGGDLPDRPHSTDGYIPVFIEGAPLGCLWLEGWSIEPESAGP